MHRPTSDDLLHLIERRRADELTDVVGSLAASEGLDRAVAVLCEVQAEVGRRWQSQRWTVADEHAASAIVDRALATAAATTAAAPRGTVVVACVEDEWHVLPARMLAEQLRARGWDAPFLGASAPAPDLGRFAGVAQPVAVALSCSMARHLPGARRSVSACHDAGVPVAVGGAAFDGPERAAAIGADRWCAGADELADALTAWALASPTLAAPAVATPAGIDGRRRRGVVDAALGTVLARVRPLADESTHEQERIRDGIDGILAAAEAAAHTADPAIVDDHLRWQASVSAARGEPDGLLDLLVRALADELAGDDELRAQLPVEV